MTIADLNAEVRSLCDADSTSYTAADLLRRVNAALETCVGKIITSDGTWQFDDTNYTDLPIGVGNLVAGQIAYSFASEYLEIEEIDILDTSGVYRRIRAFDPSETGYSFEESFNIINGVAQTAFPQYYDKQGDTIRLSGAPASSIVTLTNGIKVRFKRTASLFTSAEVSTGTKEPGIASPFHQLIAYMAAIPYCMSYKKDRVPLFEAKVQAMTKDMLAYYGHREQDKRKILSMSSVSFR